ncbi:hypothetical protein DACRYDRAFT_104542 [Dacryopinax primogenitus]|uniref:Uncharacterized protein n=1 Tax=Dacryopinax primogenitus (strain DJM 731) TaxID=1858805 RepID=M5G7F6_DACPD|nr:uncharacterized protein DACRYDRAFT_104542 [Dacryopinax primogenitus]EJU04664.1 hypothetical protein DACRYDRAFT_104542 [Dacryopinax primogenitus]
MYRSTPILILLALLPQILAQWVTQTQIDPDSGITYLDRVSYSRAGAAVATQILSTFGDELLAAATTTGPPRIVGQPGTNTGAATIVFQFTSADGNVYEATFTPTYQSPSPTIPPQVGTIISPEDWTFTQAAAVTGPAVTSGAERIWPLAQWGRVMGFVGAGVVIGAWWVL